ncbi:MAG: ParB-like protein partition protein [Parcubacteria group bacterium GW2011_GWA2_45_15]|nr:MAG: ParB-like protein partition protein [Parcubacteria group bacterium GW2011_GWA2_45_15]
MDKIKPNPFQPRRHFDEVQLKSLADSIRQYGVLQALVVTRSEVEKEDGGIGVEYELVAGERRLRAARLAGLQQVPVLIRTGEETDLMKLELAIIENIQREDLSPVDRARAFDRLVREFNFKHHEIGKKVGKSREYVSNSLRILSLPEYIINALSENKISEGHTRPLMMLIDRPAEQETLFKEIIFKKLNVREAESIARHIAVERARKLIDQELIDIEGLFKEKLGARVRIEKKEEGGRVTIDFFNKDDLRALLERIISDREVEKLPEREIPVEDTPTLTEEPARLAYGEAVAGGEKISTGGEDESLYSVTNFSI